MTKYVLLAGALGGVVLASVWVMVPFVALGNFRGPWGGSLLGGLSPLVMIWMGMLAAAIVGDFLLRRRDRRTVQPFAKALGVDPQEADEDRISQSEDEGTEQTRMFGTAEDRTAEVAVSRSVSSRAAGRPHLSAAVACDSPWTLDIRPRNPGSRLLGLAGAEVSTGYPEVDTTLVVQADDAMGVREWLADPTVRGRLLSLFERHHLQTLTLGPGASGETVLRGDLLPHLLRPSVQEPAELTHALRALADSLEQRRP